MISIYWRRLNVWLQLQLHHAISVM